MHGTGPSKQDQDVDGALSAERRAHKRMPLLWAGQLRIGERAFACIVMNLSLGGACLQLDAPVKMHDQGKLVLKRIGALSTEIVWRRQGKIGLRFTEEPAQLAQRLGEALKQFPG